MTVTSTVPKTEAERKRRKIRAFMNAWNAGRATRGTPVGQPARMPLLLGGISLSLESPGLHGADRFATLFQEVFEQLPEEVRQRIWLRWHHRQPDIALNAGMVHEVDGRDVEPVGAYCPESESFKFDWRWLSGQADDVIRCIAWRWQLRQRYPATRRYSIAVTRDCCSRCSRCTAEPWLLARRRPSPGRRRRPAGLQRILPALQMPFSASDLRAAGFRTAGRV